jgi:tetratricopeptide (TPR) repeat protein
VIGKRQIFWLFLTGVFYGPWLLKASDFPSYQKAISRLNRLDSLCKIHLKNRSLDSLWSSACNLKDLASRWKAIHPDDRQVTFYLMAGYLHQSNVFNLQARNKEAIEGYKRALSLSFQIGDTLKRHSIYNNLGILNHNMGKYDKALYFHKWALFERKRMKDSILLGDSYNSLGIICLEEKRFSQAHWLFKKSLQYRITKGPSVEKIADIFNNLGRIYSHEGNWILATLYYGKAFRLYSEAENRDGQIYILNNLSLVLGNFGFVDQAEYLLKIALAILPDKTSVFFGDLNLNLGSIYFETQKMGKALVHFKRSQETYLRLESSHRLAKLNRTMGKFYAKNHQWDFARKSLRSSLNYFEANQVPGEVCSILQEYAASFPPSYSDSILYFLQLSLDRSTKEGLISERALALVKLGGYYLNSGDLNQAIYYFDQCLATPPNPLSVGYFQEAGRGLVSCYEALGKWQEAASLNAVWSVSSDSIKQQSDKVKERLNRLILSQTQLKESVRNSDILGDVRRKHAADNRLNLFFILGILLTLAVTVIFALLIYIRKREQEGIRIKLESDLVGLKGMINQHFLANTMNAIKALINQGKTDAADVYLNKFSDLLRAALSQSKNTMIPLEEELRFIRLYIELEQFRFPRQIQFELMVDPKLETNLILVPAMLLQPILENSVQHGRRGPDRPLNISLTLFPQAGRLVFLIQDDGIGIKVGIKKKQSNRQASYGIDLTEQRIKLLGNQYKVKVDFTVEELIDSEGMVSGTQVILEVPLTNSPYS